MTTWTDEELGALLSETFNDHEADLLGEGYTEDAVRLARRVPVRSPMRPWRTIAAAAAAVVALGAVVTGATYGLHHLGGDSTATSSTANDAVRDTVHGPAGAPESNRDAAQDEAGRLVGWVALPNARRVASSPAEVLDNTGGPASATPADQIHETRFWVVPGASAAQLSQELAARPSPVPTATGSGGSGTQPDPQHPGQTIETTNLSWIADMSYSTKDYTSPELTVMLYQDGTSVDVRADAWVVALPTRPAASYVSGSVSSVTVTYRRSTAYKDSHPAGSVVVTDPAEIAHLTTVVNGLPTTPPGATINCPAFGSGGRAAAASAAFHSNAGQWTFRLGHGGCGSGVGVFRGGKQLAALDSGGFLDAVWSALSTTR